MVEAAALPETFCTVWTNVFQKGVRGGELVPGDTLLVHGGSSGIGTTAIQLAKSRGSDVIVTAVTQTKCNACLELGANAAVNYREESEGWFAAVKEATGGQGVDVVLGCNVLNKKSPLLGLSGTSSSKITASRPSLC